MHTYIHIYIYTYAYIHTYIYIYIYIYTYAYIHTYIYIYTYVYTYMLHNVRYIHVHTTWMVKIMNHQSSVPALGGSEVVSYRLAFGTLRNWAVLERDVPQNHGKTMGKPWKTIGKPRKMVVEWDLMDDLPSGNLLHRKWQMAQSK